MKLMYLLATSAVVLVMMASCTRQSVTGYTLTCLLYTSDAADDLGAV